MNVEELTPVERRGDYWFKRDDLFEVYGARGGEGTSRLPTYFPGACAGLQGRCNRRRKGKPAVRNCFLHL